MPMPFGPPIALLVVIAITLLVGGDYMHGFAAGFGSGLVATMIMMKWRAD